LAAVESDVKGGAGEREGGEGEKDPLTSALLAAAAEGDCERIRALVSAGCDVNACEHQVTRRSIMNLYTYMHTCIHNVYTYV
jgi:hypothetical protein